MNIDKGDDNLTTFNKQQKEAIDFYKGACGVVASAGSGKSTVLLNRIHKLVNHHKEISSDILAITFTSKTANELKSKLKNMKLDKVNVGTFHSVCMRIMMSEGVNVGGKLVPEWKAENWFKDIDSKPNTIDILSYISYQKSYKRTYEDEFIAKESEYTEDELRAFYKAYERTKKSEGLYDFDDYLLIALDILIQNKGKYAFEFVLVDEHQDSNLVQNMILKELCQSGNIFAVGDVRQSIYSFRGGDVEYFVNFSQYWDDVKIINLFMNYRSTNNVVCMSNGFIKPYFKNYEHYVDAEAFNKKDGIVKLKSYESEEKESLGVVEKIERMINDGVKPEEIAILYRLNSQSIFIENELKQRGIEYDITNDSSFFKRKEISAILCYLRLIHNSEDDNALDNIFKFRGYPLKFFSNKVLDKIRNHSTNNGISLLESLTRVSYDAQWQLKSALSFERAITRLRLQNERGVHLSTLIDNIITSFEIVEYIEDKYNGDEINDRLKSLTILKTFVKNNNLEQFITFVYSDSGSNKKKTNKNVVKLMTIHASKGLEWENAFLVGVEDGIFPHERSNVEEEARLFYVGITRPMSNLYISEIGKGNRFTKEYFE